MYPKKSIIKAKESISSSQAHSPSLQTNKTNLTQPNLNTNHKMIDKLLRNLYLG